MPFRIRRLFTSKLDKLKQLEFLEFRCQVQFAVPRGNRGFFTLPILYRSLLTIGQHFFSNQTGRLLLVNFRLLVVWKLTYPKFPRTMLCTDVLRCFMWVQWREGLTGRCPIAYKEWKCTASAPRVVSPQAPLETRTWMYSLPYFYSTAINDTIL